MLQRSVLFAFCLSLCVSPVLLYDGQERGLLRGDQVTILYEEPWKGADQGVADAYSTAKRNVEHTLGWAATLSPKGCVLACPTQALALQDGLAGVARPLACDYNGMCEAVCPTGAITRPFEIVPAE